MYGSQEADYRAVGSAGYGGRPGSITPPYASNGSVPPPYASNGSVPPPYVSNTTSVAAGVAAGVAAVEVVYDNSNAAAAAMSSPFGVSNVDVAGPVPIDVPVAPPAGGQQIMVVTHTFMPNIDDELSIITGQSVRIIAVYDDGWCKVRKLGAVEAEGVVPYKCLGDLGTGAHECSGRIGRRAERPVKARQQPVQCSWRVNPVLLVL